jgi:hypothetical protein
MKNSTYQVNSGDGKECGGADAAKAFGPRLISAEPRS